MSQNRTRPLLADHATVDRIVELTVDDLATGHPHVARELVRATVQQAAVELVSTAVGPTAELGRQLSSRADARLRAAGGQLTAVRGSGRWRAPTG